jgi:hypothetical protein
MPDLRFQATPRQWALIAVLGAALIGVLVFNQPANSAADAPIALAVRPAVAAAQYPELESAHQRPRLPEYSADEVAAYNPFARPQNAAAQTPQAEVTANETQAVVDAEAQRRAELQKALADLRSKKVRFVIGNKNGAAAMLGNQWIRAGEIVSGFRVIKVDQTGVELQPAD